MSEPYVMNKKQVKKYLGLIDASLDSKIALYLPVVSDALTGDQGLLNNSYLLSAEGVITDGSDIISGLSETAVGALSIGDIVKAPGLQTGINSYEIISIDEDARSVQISGDATLDFTGSIMFRALPIGAKPTAAGMVAYQITTNSISGAGKAAAGGVKSERYGPISVTFGDGGELGPGGYPKSLERSLYNYRRPRYI